MTLISIKSALDILKMFRNKRLTSEERERIELAIEQLSLAQVSPEYMEYLHLPLDERAQFEVAE